MGPDERLRRAEKKNLAVRSRGGMLSGDSGLWTPDGPVLSVPRIGEFVTRPDYLNIETLYPRQLTLLKLVFLELDDLTLYDDEVIAEWTADFRLAEGDDGIRRYQGSYGMPPDILDRADRCRGEGRPWFHDVIAPTGRRAGKGFCMSICCARVLWWLFCRPEGLHRFLHLPNTKRLNISVFAGKKDQAVGNLWRDIVELLLTAPCFKPFIARAPRGGDTLLLYTPAQLQDGQRPDPERALVEIVARESTRVAGRGPASVALFFDEMAYLTPTGLSRSADEVFTAAAPANQQFGHYGFVAQISSPWQKTDRFYENYEAALRVDTAGNSIYYDALVLQVPGWELYRDWALTQ
jgi:hypothetical protein